jgi:hypothetical protein
MRNLTYPHNEQIEYNTNAKLPLGAQRNISSGLPDLICIAALRQEISSKCRLGFPCECINCL